MEAGDWEELNKKTYEYNVCLQNNFKVYFSTQIQANKIASIYLDASIYLNIWVLYKTDVGNFLADVSDNAFFQYTSAIAACRRELERLLP